MSDEPNTNNQEQQEEVDYKALYEQTKGDLESLVAKKEELLDETKKAKNAKNEVLQKMQQLEAQKSENMKKNGEFEQLWKTEQERAAKLEQQLSEFKTNIKTEKLNNMAMKVANDLSKGRAENAELLSVFVGQSLSQYADDMGNIDADVLNSIKQQFESDTKYAPLLGGSKATGGGAVGGKPGNTQRSEITRSEFDAMSPVKQMAFIKSGGRTVDDKQ